MRRVLFSLIVLITALPSCNSFNSYHTVVLETTAAAGGSPNTEPIGASHDTDSRTGTDNLSCPFFEMPHQDGMPELPYRELQMAEERNDPKAADQVVKNHILDLRIYIRETSKKMNDAYNNYLIACRNRQDRKIQQLPVPSSPEAASGVKK